MTKEKAPRSTQRMAPHMEVTMTRRAAWDRRRWPPPRAAIAIAASIVACVDPTARDLLWRAQVRHI